MLANAKAMAKQEREAQQDLVHEYEQEQELAGVV